MKVILLHLFLFTICVAHAQVISSFSLTSLQSHAPVSLDDYSGRTAIVVIFTSANCPFDKLYEKRVNELVRVYSPQNVQFILINSTSGTASLPSLSRPQWFESQHIPYLIDADQKVLHQFQARKSTETFILQPSPAGYRILYHGSIDNNPQVAEDVKQSYVRSNLEAILNHKDLPYDSNRTVGCMVN